MVKHVYWVVCVPLLLSTGRLINLLICYTINDSILHGERLSKRGLPTFQFLLCLVFDVQWSLNGTGTCRWNRIFYCMWPHAPVSSHIVGQNFHSCELLVYLFTFISNWDKVVGAPRWLFWPSMTVLCPTLEGVLGVQTSKRNDQNCNFLKVWYVLCKLMSSHGGGGFSLHVPFK